MGHWVPWCHESKSQVSSFFSKLIPTSTYEIIISIPSFMFVFMFIFVSISFSSSSSSPFRGYHEKYDKCIYLGSLGPRVLEVVGIPTVPGVIISIIIITLGSWGPLGSLAVLGSMDWGLWGSWGPWGHWGSWGPYSWGLGSLWCHVAPDWLRGGSSSLWFGDHFVPSFLRLKLPN